MTDHNRATGPTLAARIGGTFDYDNAVIVLPAGRKVRCRLTGAVVFHAGEVEVRLGSMSDGLDALVDAYRQALASVEYVGR